MKTSAPVLFWGLIFALTCWGVGNVIYWEIIKGYPACRLCAFPRFFYVALMAVCFLRGLDAPKIYPSLALLLLGGEVFVASGQVFQFLCVEGLCRTVSLPEKINFIAATLTLILTGLLYLIFRPKKRHRFKHFAWVLGFLPFISPASGGMDCTGRLINPITDVCWKCLFPLRVAGFELVGSGMPDTPVPTRLPICFCKRPTIPVPVPGIPIGFWEPARLVDVTKSPLCLVSLGGLSLGSGPTRGTKSDKENTSFYHVHWYIYPVVYWLELLMDFLCLETMSFDLAYLTEFDPLWSDDSKSSILNPEAILFGTPIAQGACIADCLASTAGLCLDPLFWCSGCQGSLYPFTGTVGAHNGGVQASTLLVGRMIAKLHRSLLAWGYFGEAGLCGKYPCPIIRKSQYRYQMTYPIPEVLSCKRIGQTEVLWQSGREFPIKGEDFGYLVWRKRDCCVL